MIFNSPPPDSSWSLPPAWPLLHTWKTQGHLRQRHLWNKRGQAPSKHSVHDLCDNSGWSRDTQDFLPGSLPQFRWPREQQPPPPTHTRQPSPHVTQNRSLPLFLAAASLGSLGRLRSGPGHGARLDIPCELPQHLPLQTATSDHR